jgi:putative ABC transport system permease protein
MTLQVGLPQGTAAQRKEFLDKIKQALSALGGIESVSFANRLAIFGSDDRRQAQADAVSNKFPVASDVVDVDYFDTVGIQVASGRSFITTDGANSQKVAVINRKMADMFWPGRDPLDKPFVAGDPPERFVVVGVIENGKYANFDEPAPAMMYSALN